MASAAYGARTLGRRGLPLAMAAIFFGVVWIGAGVAPTLVAGYASPRHMYLASVGWAILLGLPVELAWRRETRAARAIAVTAAVVVLAVYAVQLRREVARWEARAGTSSRVVRDLEAEAQRLPAGALVVAGAPRPSFDFAVPHALRPPFTGRDVTAQLRVVTHSSIHCCPAHLWEPHTRGLLRAWLDDPARPPVAILHWDETSGQLLRVDDAAQPFIRALVPILAETRDVASLDAAILDVVEKLTGAVPARPGR